MATLDREALAKYAKRRYRTEPVEWIAPGMTMVIQSLTERERAEIERKIGDPDCKASTRALLLIAAIVDDNHNRIFDESHAEWLDSLDSQAMAGLSEAVSEHCDLQGNRLTPIEDIAKN